MNRKINWSLMISLICVTTLSQASNEVILPVRVVQQIGQDFKSTTQSAVQYENEIGGLIQRLNDTLSLFESTNCASKPQEESCVILSQTMHENYKLLLDAATEKLPEVQKSITRTQRRIANELIDNVGFRSYNDLQSHFQSYAENSKNGNNNSAGRDLITRRSGGGVRLSERLRQIQKIFSVNMNSEPPVVTVATMLLDMQDSEKILNSLLSEMEAQKMTLALSESFGGVPEQMIASVGKIKELIFGEQSGPDNMAPAPLTQELQPETEDWEKRLRN